MANRRIVFPPLRDGGQNPPPNNNCCVTAQPSCAIGTLCCPNFTVTKTLNAPQSCCTPPPKSKFLDGGGQNPPPPPPCNNQLCLFNGDSQVVSYNIVATSGSGSQLCFLVSLTLTNTCSTQVNGISITGTLTGSVNGTTTTLGTFNKMQGNNTTTLGPSGSQTASFTYPLAGCVQSVPDGLDTTTVQLNITVTYTGLNQAIAVPPVCVPIQGGSCSSQCFWLYDANGSFVPPGNPAYPQNWIQVQFTNNSFTTTAYQTLSSTNNCGQQQSNTVQLVGLDCSITAPQGPPNSQTPCGNVIASSTVNVQVNCANVEVDCSSAVAGTSNWSLSKVGSPDCGANDTVNYTVAVNPIEGENTLRVSATAKISDCTQQTVGCCNQPNYQKQFTAQITGYTVPCDQIPTDGSGGIQLETEPIEFELGCNNSSYDIVQCVSPPSGQQLTSVVVSISSSATTVNLPNTDGSCSFTTDTTTETNEASCCLPITSPNCTVTVTDQLTSNGKPIPSQTDGKGCCYADAAIAQGTTSQDDVIKLFSQNGLAVTQATTLEYSVTFHGSCTCVTNTATLTNSCGSCAGQVVSAAVSTDLTGQCSNPPPQLKSAGGKAVPSNGPNSSSNTNKPGCKTCGTNKKK